jgi:glycosyltransferase involved in cell wall biosynthesis
VALSVVVATRDRPHLLDGCLSALIASLGRDDELVVVDSCSSSDSTSEVARAHGAKLLRCERAGASRARNVGWQSAGKPAIAFVDDDVIVDRAWAVSLSAVLERHPSSSFFTGRLGLRPEDTGAERPVAFFDHPAPVLIDRSVVDGLGHGANFTVRRDALEAVGGYDESLGPGAVWRAGEDLDLIDRLVAAGYCGRYEPSVRAAHVQWRRRTDLLRVEWNYGVGQGARLTRLHDRDRDRYRAISQISWHEQGWETFGRCVREGYEFGALSALVRLTATALGRTTSLLLGKQISER